MLAALVNNYLPTLGADSATWIVAVATCLSVIVNVVVVVVALLPIHREKKQRRERGKLTAAYLSIPLGAAYKDMHLASIDLQTFLQARDQPDGPLLGASVNRLRGVPDRARSYLLAFNMADAAYLEGDRGVQVARAVGEAKMVLDALDLVIQRFDAVTNEYDASIAAAGTHVPANLVKAYFTARQYEIKKAEFLPAIFNPAAEHLGEFVDYCERLSKTASKIDPTSETQAVDGDA